MASPIQYLTYWFTFVLFIIGLLVLLIEGVCSPVTSFWRRRRNPIIEPTSEDLSRYEQERTQRVHRMEQDNEQLMLKKEQKRRQKEELKYAQVLEDRRKRIGYGHTLKSSNEEWEYEDPLQEARRIRREQDREYEESLTADELKEQQIKHKQEMAILKQKQKQERIQKLEKNCPIPPDSADKSCFIAIRLPNGVKIQRRFYSNSPVQSLIDFVEAHGDMEANNFQLVTNIPRKVFSDKVCTLEESGLVPKALIIAEEV